MERSFNLHENVPLAPLTTLKIGGTARYFIVAGTEAQLHDAIAFAEQESLNVFILGGGSNVLIADQGFNGLVVQIGLRGISRTADQSIVTAGAGEDWDQFVSYCVENCLAGVECLSGIPGFVGGTPVQNVGAYGQEVSETIASVRCFDRRTKQFTSLSNADCRFEYRTSIFNSTERDHYIVAAVTYSLRKNGEPKVVYKDLIEHFAGRHPALAEVRNAVLEIRRAKSMVIDAADPDSKSAGSFFKNPVIEKDTLEKIRSIHENIPSFAFGDKVKIPAAWLIENSGFGKGFSLGNAGISTKHTLALINRGGASSEDMLRLKAEIQKRVKEEFGIELQPEPVFVGF